MSSGEELIQKVRFYQLHKQNLLEKSTEDYFSIIRKQLALHSTDYLTPYLSLWERMTEFNPEQLLEEHLKGKIIRARCFRMTLFFTLPELLRVIFLATSDTRAYNIKYIKTKIFDDEDKLKKISNEIVRLLEKEKQLTARTITKKLDSFDKALIRSAMRYLEYNNIIIRATQKTITDKFYKYALLRDWIPEFSQQRTDPEESAKTIIQKYLECFGPANFDDICWWLPFKRKSDLVKLLKELQAELVPLTFVGEEYYMTKDDHSAFQHFQSPEQKKLPVVNFLPYEDHYPKAYKNRSWFIDKETTPNLFGIRAGKIDIGEIRPSVWVNGQVVGRWEQEWLDKKKTAVKVVIPYLNTSLCSSAAQELVESKRKAIEQFINLELVPLRKKGWQKKKKAK